jgi:NADPH2:quinone reductase
MTARYPGGGKDEETQDARDRDQKLRRPGVLQLAERSDPTPGPGEVVVRVMATSVNPVDTKIRGTGRGVAPALPAVLGADVAGTVAAVGAGVETFRPGDEVYGCAGGVTGMNGALAEYLLTDPALLAPRPPQLSWREAAALPLVTITAWEGLFDRARVAAGQSVLVFAGTGGVGHIAVQLAKAAGARVVATASSADKAELARSLGADAVVDHRRSEPADWVAAHTGGKSFETVFDTVGNENLDRAFAAAGLNGQVVSIVTQKAVDLIPMHAKGLSLHVVFMLIQMLHGIGRAQHGAILREAASLVATGKLRPLVDPARFALEQAADAHRHLESGAAVGKVVIEVAA